VPVSFATRKITLSVLFALSRSSHIQRNEYRQARDTKMTAKTTPTEYLLLFRGCTYCQPQGGTGSHKDRSPEEIQRHMAQFNTWFERLKKEGSFKSGHPLVHNRKIVAGRNVVTDGPFAESKEAIGGFFIIQADSFEQAVEIAKGCPCLENGQTIEVGAIRDAP
jgi:hypothetical protein